MGIRDVLYQLHEPVVGLIRQSEDLFHLFLCDFLAGLFAEADALSHNNYFAVFLI